MNDDILLTREQIGSALDYSDPDVALSKLHKKHHDRLDDLSVVTKLVSTDGKSYQTRLYSDRGIMEICRWSRQPKANQFMDWVWDIVSQYRNGSFTNTQLDLQPLADAITNLTNVTANMQQDISTLRHQMDQQQKQIPKKKFTYWTSKMFPKYRLLMDYFEIDRKELFHHLFTELQNTYPDLDLNQLQEDYCFKNGLDTCYTMDVIEHTKTVRELFQSLVDSLLAKYNLYNDDQSLRRSTIFDD